MSTVRKVQIDGICTGSVISYEVFITHLISCSSSPDSRDAELADDLWRKSEEILEINVEGLLMDDDKESVFGISAAGTAQMAK